MQVASVPLDLVLMQVPLISNSTRSAKLPFFQKAEAVVVIVEFARIQDYENGVRGRMHETNRIFEQTSPPHFCLKVVCKKEGVFSGAYSTRIVLTGRRPPKNICMAQGCLFGIEKSIFSSRGHLH